MPGDHGRIRGHEPWVTHSPRAQERDWRGYTICPSLLSQLHQWELGLGLGWQGPQRHLASPSPSLDPQMGKSSVLEGMNTHWISHTPEFLLQLPLFFTVECWAGIGWWALVFWPLFWSTSLSMSLPCSMPFNCPPIACRDQSFGNTDVLCLIACLWHFCQSLVILRTRMFACFPHPCLLSSHVQLILFLRANFLILLAWRTLLLNPKFKSSLLCWPF